MYFESLNKNNYELWIQHLIRFRIQKKLNILTKNNMFCFSIKTMYTKALLTIVLEKIGYRLFFLIKHTIILCVFRRDDGKTSHHHYIIGFLLLLLLLLLQYYNDYSCLRFNRINNDLMFHCISHAYTMTLKRLKTVFFFFWWVWIFFKPNARAIWRAGPLTSCVVSITSKPFPAIELSALAKKGERTRPITYYAVVTSTSTK